jgi:hypothetical protein
MAPRKETVHCGEHGQQQATFVCQHLAQSLRTKEMVGFFTADDPDNPRPDAWCAACEKKVWMTGGKWNDESEAFARVTMICGRCYDRAKILNADASI